MASSENVLRAIEHVLLAWESGNSCQATSRTTECVELRSEAEKRLMSVFEKSHKRLSLL